MFTDYDDFFPARLAQLRMQKGVSARDMSLSLGQADNYINNIELKKAFPSMSAFFSICFYLGVEPEEFFDRRNASPSTLQELVGEVKPLGESAHRHLLEFVKEIKKQS